MRLFVVARAAAVFIAENLEARAVRVFLNWLAAVQTVLFAGFLRGLPYAVIPNPASTAAADLPAIGCLKCLPAP